METDFLYCRAARHVVPTDWREAVTAIRNTTHDDTIQITAGRRKLGMARPPVRDLLVVVLPAVVGAIDECKRCSAERRRAYRMMPDKEVAGDE